MKEGSVKCRGLEIEDSITKAEFNSSDTRTTMSKLWSPFLIQQGSSGHIRSSDMMFLVVVTVMF